MSDNKFFYVSETIPIPSILYSVEKDGPFTQCIVCQCELNEETPYLIEKGFKGERVIFEYAMCYTCRDEMTETLSKESITKLQQMWDKKVDLLRRRRTLLKKSITSIEPWIEYCILTGDRRSELETYQIFAECQGSKMLFSYFPYIVGEPAIEGLVKLLSKKTKDALDDFTDTYLGLGPEFTDVPQDFLLIL